MNTADRWLLPAGVTEILPPDAARIEHAGRQLLDLYASWGYEQVFTPFIEYLDSLLIGAGADLDLQTFKLTDQLSGRMMGIRADITPQVARIDAHRLQREGPVRLCYLGTVLHTLPDGFARSRTPMQIGAELYGHAGLDSDLEIFTLMLETLRLAGVEEFYLDAGHVGIYRGLVQQAGLSGEQEHQLFDALQRKAVPEIHQLLSAWRVEPVVQAMLAALVRLDGGREVLALARAELAAGNAQVQSGLTELEQLAARVEEPKLHFDLAELRGYGYHTGLLFSAYVAGHGQAVAQGGRYDHIGQAFGRARPATGFTVDLRTLLMLDTLAAPSREAIFAPLDDDPALAEKIKTLRATGQAVIQALGGQAGGAREMGCAHELRRHDGEWRVTAL
jgi:ATP phosphoribosyltransferase regulatory subunit